MSERPTCRKLIGSPAARATASLRLTTSYGGETTRAASSGTGRNARKARSCMHGTVPPGGARRQPAWHAASLTLPHRRTKLTTQRQRRPPQEESMEYHIISADDHIDMPWLPKDLWQRRVPAQWRERAPRVADTADGPYWMCGEDRWDAWGGRKGAALGGRRSALERGGVLEPGV